MQAYDRETSVFIKRAIKLFEDQKKWDKDNLDAFVDLFKDDNLPWTSEDRMTVLESASTSRHVEVLEIFAILVEIVLAAKARTESGVDGSITRQWFKRVLIR